MSYEAWGDGDEGHEGCFTEQQVAEAVEEERDKIVAWLKRQRPEGSAAWDYAEAIERGAHRDVSTASTAPVHGPSCVECGADLPMGATYNACERCEAVHRKEEA